MKAMKQVMPGVDLPVSYLSNGKMYPVEGDEAKTLQIPFYRDADGTCTIRWRMSWFDRIRMLMFGDLWQSVNIGNGPLQPFGVGTFCPLTKNGNKFGGRSPAVIMSGRDMLNKTGLADIAVLEKINDKYYIAGEEHISSMVLGEPTPKRWGRRSFATENEALAALAVDLRKKNKGKWWER